MFFLVLMLAIATQGITITNHMKGGLGARENTPYHNQIVMTLVRRNPVSKLSALFNSELESVVEADQCTLTWSGKTNKQLALTLDCPLLNNKEYHRPEEKAPMPLLENTVSYLKHNHYEVEHLEYLQRTKKPFVWYEADYHNLDAVIREGREQRQAQKLAKENSFKAKPRTIIHGNYAQYPVPWGLDRIDTRYAPRLDSTYNYDNYGENVDIYIIDTGIRVTHYEFHGRATFLANTAGDSIDTDCNGHGTHVASVAAGKTYGVAKNASLWAVKVLDCAGNGDSFTIATGIMAIAEHAATRTGKRAVASLSLGGDFSITINNAVLSLLADGINPIVAAGNEYSNACDYSPAVLGQSSSVVTVGASTQQDTRPPWSNYGACVSITAPGAEIIGAYYTSNSATVVLSGTSMATPFVSGVAALILNQNLTLTNAEVKTLLQSWATPNIISGATSGGKNLLFSLVHITELPNIVTPAPTSTPPTATPPPPGSFSNSGGSSSTATPYNFLLMIGLVLIMIVI